TRTNRAGGLREGLPCEIARGWPFVYDRIKAGSAHSNLHGRQASIVAKPRLEYPERDLADLRINVRGNLNIGQQIRPLTRHKSPLGGISTSFGGFGGFARVPRL